MACARMTMHCMFRVCRSFIGWLALGDQPLAVCFVLCRMMNVFFCCVSRRDNADCAPQRNHKYRNDAAHMSNG
ncbi:MAG: hypothetical protein CMM61_16475 [Rhodospirillaceae bacterium]|nr:hypothetical protein [Rhodospirillaceae bacterium]